VNTYSLKMAVLALAVVALISLIPYIGAFVFAPVVALVIATVAGRHAARMATSSPATAATKAGALVGVGALAGAVIGLGALVLVVVNIPGVQEFIRASEPNPEARLPYEWIMPIGALAGIIVGAIVGLFDLALSVVAGLVAGWMHNQNHAQAA
jgi:hypothetical protein